MRSPHRLQKPVTTLGAAPPTPAIALGTVAPNAKPASAPPAPARGLRSRIVLYSHDTMGLGHKRRNLLIAQALGSAGLEVDVLLISGMGDANAMAVPDGVDTLTLPALYKNADGQYAARRLNLELQEIVQLRSQLILAAVKNFRPNVLIVDNVPRGAVRELDATLEYLRRRSTRCILGLRDVLDTPATVRRDWKRAENVAAIRRYYDTVWIYGDPAIYDPRREYRFPADITEKMRPLGYLDCRDRAKHVDAAARAQIQQLGLPSMDQACPKGNCELVLCQVGGGQDGATLAEAFAQAIFPANTTGILLTGPFMPVEAQQRLQALAQANPRLRLVGYLAEPTLLLERASRVVAMGGYNTTCEILAYQKPALVVPRITPRQEQWIRADRLCRQGLIDMLHPTQLSPQTLTQWLHQPIAAATERPAVNLSGLDNLVADLKKFLIAPALPALQAS
ncbi:glycosyltransferase [Leptolyngbya sp. CCNP1308]|uniref:glycosyltransferase family protein n=1 Tax=Leptolyngbya sp. CCNP1308 TaxID=3110255 RepID=UPI002B21252A|nr:glycosyltransferase [Leptolyngbya sp. CCNP1308]MEA5447247.1 glycosyltransferase [Leptolyngbya sp. CCNP1308]